MKLKLILESLSLDKVGDGLIDFADKNYNTYNFHIKHAIRTYIDFYEEGAAGDKEKQSTIDYIVKVAYEDIKKLFSILKSKHKFMDKDIDNIRMDVIYERYFYDNKDGMWGESKDELPVYAKNSGMGWYVNLHNGEAKEFEGTDDPTPGDLRFRQLFMKEKEITLYGTHGREFVLSWKTKGIPSEVYFADRKQIAMSYWHTHGDDVLVEIKVSNKHMLQTADNEYRTIDKLSSSEFKMRIIG